MTATNTKPEPTAQQAQQPQAPFVRLSDGAASEQWVTVTFLRTHLAWMAGQSAGFPRDRAEWLCKRRIARSYDPAIDRQTFESRRIEK